MIDAKIVDMEFMHHGTMSLLGSKYINWLHEFDATEDDTVFFTDTMCEVADQVTCRKKILILIEPPEVHPEAYQYAFERHELFDHVITYSQELISKFPNKCLWFPPSTLWVRRFSIGQEKPNLVSLIASSKNYTSGHKVRGKAIEALKNSPKVDILGRGREKELDKKEDGLLSYKFSIAIENSQYDNFFSEKILDPMATGAIPIYWGTKNIGNYFNKNGIIQFETIDELVEIVNGLETVRIDRLAIQDNFFETVKNYYSVEDWLYSKYRFLFSEE